MTYRAKIFMVLIFFQLMVSCEIDHGHNHEDIDSNINLLGNPVSCASLSTVEFQDALLDSYKIVSPGKLFDDTISEALGTLCNAVVERKINVTCERLEQFGLHIPSSSLYLATKVQRISLYFGRRTPDGFGQYIYLVDPEKDRGDLSGHFNKDNPCQESSLSAENGLTVLVIPAYHERQIRKDHFTKKTAIN